METEVIWKCKHQPSYSTRSSSLKGDRPLHKLSPELGFGYNLPEWTTGSAFHSLRTTLSITTRQKCTKALLRKRKWRTSGMLGLTQSGCVFLFWLAPLPLLLGWTPLTNKARLLLLYNRQALAVQQQQQQYEQQRQQEIILTTSSLASGEWLQITSFTETQTGKATPRSTFLPLTFLSPNHVNWGI